MPESPKFLLTKKRYDETRDAINYIARWNHQKEFKGKFDREILDELENAEGSINKKAGLERPTEVSDLSTPASAAL